MNKGERTILRVGTYPTYERRGMGYHSYKIGNQSGFHTIFLTPADDGKRLDVIDGVELIEKRFLMSPRPRSGMVIGKLAFFVKRLSSILHFSCYGIYLIMKRKCQIVHIHSPMFMLVALFARITGRRAYITFHGTDFYRIERSSLYKYFGRMLNGAFAISPVMIKRLTEIHGANKVKQVFNGVDKDVYVNHKGKRNKSMLAVGTLKEEKGFDVLIDAFSMFLDSSNDHRLYHLSIVGDGHLRNELVEKVVSNNLQKNISILGHKETSELVDLYNESEVFILSSISEGFPKVLLEATASGCKVVSTDVGSVSQIYPSYPLICAPNEPEQLAGCLTCAVNTAYEQLENFYVSCLNRFTWESVCESYFQVYRQCH